MKNRFILSFDVEEFDTPLDYGKALPMHEQMQVSEIGLRRVLDLLTRYEVKATFFTTANFAETYPDLMCQIATRHEVASHGYYHTTFEIADLKKSKDKLEQIIQKPIIGYRMARMAKVDEWEIAQAGYQYNSSLHPIYLPGRYNNFFKPRRPFFLHNVLQIPASVTPLIRFPMFWLSFKNFPLWMIQWAARWILWADPEKQVNFYFHPWEFTDVSDQAKFGLPFYVSRHSKQRILDKLEHFIRWAKPQGDFITFADLYQEFKA
ncbi:MAG: polysaccharide deacetylase family protein [Microscillaceae bacterium]|nr:polysaccharide deacetylase family protein [Microscillaceae bacterium]